MNDAAALLFAFGFTTRDAARIAERALANDLNLTDIQAWIDEAQRSTSLNNPLGFVRARLQSGDKVPSRPAADCRHGSRRSSYSDRQRYAEWIRKDIASSRRTSQLDRQRDDEQIRNPPRSAVQTCRCGRVVYATRLCPECDRCPTCCECVPADQPDEQFKYKKELPDD